jgi:hypothetical protein
MCGSTNTPKSFARELQEIKYYVVLFRELSKLNKPLIMVPKWSEESTQRKQELLILVYLCSRTACRLRNQLDAMLQ